MGIPKFFRWISERYPLCSTLITATNVPVFDNLYLDMNGIIHSASHPNDASGPAIARPEHLVFKEIFASVELLFSKIRPRRVFFLAVDGVAPRAKLNQQRSRRFRSAQERQESESRHPSESMFDSNCITPGTEFMYSLQQHLEYFIAKKVASDPLWRSVRIIFSGPSVPGEGEHKIMEYIRECKGAEGYDANTRHCLYGLDADLILLGLLSHDPHFALLREEVTFGGKGSRRAGKPAGDEPRFYLMYLGLLRDYIREEFIDMCSGALQVEKVIDDIILMSMLIGNDFLPNLPNMHISQNALGLLFDAYKAVRPRLSGYINEEGRVQCGRLASVLSRLSSFEMAMFSDETGVVCSGMTGREYAVYSEFCSKFQTAADGFEVEGAGSVDGFVFLGKLCAELGIACTRSADGGSAEVIRTDRRTVFGSERDRRKFDADMQCVFDKYDSMPVVTDGRDAIAAAHQKWKLAYYRQKMGIGGARAIMDLAREYVRGMQWVTLYYYEGVKSWSWFYPYHYGPHLTDLIEALHDMDTQPIAFTLGEPYMPLEQLMAVLPKASSSLVPACLAVLMDSELKEFYPAEFKSDLNGKKNSWEAVVLIPFIDEHRLKRAVSGTLDLLSPGERLRNATGAAHSFQYSLTSTYTNSAPSEYFSSVQGCQCLRERFFARSGADQVGFWKGLCLGVSRQTVGFPSLYSTPQVAARPSLEHIGVAVFNGQPSANPSIVLSLVGRVGSDDLQGRIVLVDWPCLQEAIVENVVRCSKDEAKQAQDKLGKYKGIRVDKITSLVHVRRLVARRVSAEGEPVVQWSKSTFVYPQQLVVTDAQLVSLYWNQARVSLGDLYAVGSVGVCVCSGEHYGALARINSVDADRKLLSVSLSSPVRANPDMRQAIADGHAKHLAAAHYWPLQDTARSVGMSAFLCSKIMSTFLVFRSSEKIDIGLQCKYEARGLYAEDWCLKGATGAVMFSALARNVLAEYAKAFPKVFSRLESLVRNDRITIEDMSPHDTKQAHQVLLEMRAWLKKRGVHDLRLVGAGSQRLSADMIRHLEASRLFYSQKFDGPTLALPLMCILVPATASDRLGMADAKERLVFELGDRVRYVGKLFAFGALGTTVGVIHGNAAESVEVLLDLPQIGLGGDLNGRCASKGRGIVCAREELFNITRDACSIRIDLGAKVSGASGVKSITGMLKSASISTRKSDSASNLKPAPQFPRHC